MKIDMFYVWFLSLVVVVIFQNLFTYTKTDFDVSYVYKTLDNSFGYGHATITSSEDLPMLNDLAKNIVANSPDSQLGGVIILSTNKRSQERYFRWTGFIN